MSNLDRDNNKTSKSEAKTAHEIWDKVNRWTDPRYWMCHGPFDFDSSSADSDFWRSSDLRHDEKAKTGNGADHGAGNDAAATYPDTLDALKGHVLWVVWKLVDIPGRGKTKVPFNPRTDGQARSDDPSTWGAYDWTKRVAKKHGGKIGVMFGPVGELHLAGIDLDSCRDPRTGEMEPWALDVIRRFASYAEVSPSGTGVKIFFYVLNSDKTALDKLFGGADKHGRQFKKGGGEHPQAIEIYRSNRYFATTFEQFENYSKLRIVPVADVDWLINVAGPALKSASANAKASSSSSGAYKGSTNQGNDNSRSGKAFREGARMKAGGATYEQMAEALRNSSDPDIAAWTKEKGESNNERELHRIYDHANTGMGSLPEGCTLEHFHAYMPMHDYIHTPTMKHWPASSVNARLKAVPLFKADGSPVVDKKGNQKEIPASVHLDKTKYVDQKTWAPGEPMLIEDRLINKGGWFEHKGGRCFNEYRGPTIAHGDPAQAQPWIDHWKKMYPDDYERAIKYMAHCVQHPGVKINHALFLGGDPGIGKDTGLEPLRYAVGEWNFSDIGPGDLFEAFNPYVKSVVLRINEAHDLGDVSRYSFYERIKIYAAAPPSVLECNEKHVKQYYVPNAMGVIMTSNHKTDGIYLPADDRRHDVMWSNCKKEDFEEGYWNRLWGFYENGGYEHVAAYLAMLDISDFDPKAAPPKTDAFWAIVDAGRAPEEGELADVIDLMGNPKALTLNDLIEKTVFNASLAEWLKDRKNRRNIPHRLKSCGYEPFRNPDAKDGHWKIGRDRHAIYVQEGLTIRERMEAAKELVKKGKPQRSWSKGKRQRSWSKAKPRRSWTRATPKRPTFAAGSINPDMPPDYDAPPET